MNIVPHSTMPRHRLLLAGAISAALGGCAAGPDYLGPPQAAPVAQRAPAFHRAAMARAVATPPLAQWWTALNDPVLDAIERQALQASPTLAQAQARLRNARATLHERQAALLPSGGAQAAYLRTHIPSQIAGGSQSAQAESGGAGSANAATDLYSLGLDATWQIDLFGGTRRRVQSARATAGYQQAELEDAQVTLTADVARAYVNLRDRQHRLDLARDNTAIQLHMLGLTGQRRAGGTASDLDVERLRTQLKQTQSEMPMLAAAVEIYTDQLAQLAGQEPCAFEATVAAPRSVPVPPAVTQVGDPASLIRRRPDIRAAERQIATSNALIGANIAQYFPQVTLLGTIGYSATQTDKLFAGNALTYLGGPSIAWNIFNFPKIGAQVEEAKADTAAAQAAYRKTVLAALLDAENALSQFGHQRDDVDILAQAEASARHSAALSDMRLAGGTTSLIDTLDIERQRIQTQSSLAQGQAELTSDWVALQSSLGLGWGTPEGISN